MTLRPNDLHVYNTLSRSKELFAPLDPPRVGMYVCGPTVYGDAHIGHAKSYISFDVIVRYLRYLGYNVTYVQNITDVGHLTDDADQGEDKVERTAKAERIHPMQIAQRYTWRYFEDMARLNVLKADIQPFASGHIIEQIELVKRLIAGGHAYEAGGNVYFDVASWPKYGKLSGRSVDEMLSGTRIESAADKRAPADFALWKRAEPGHIMQWPSPWGMGFPGWHLECSAMSMKYLGESFDIHGGGMENQFPHHEDEIAQAEAATPGSPGFVKYWLHNNMVTVGGQKMGKSLGNFITLQKAFEKWDPMVLRLFILQSHYRSPLDFSDEALGATATGYDGLTMAFGNIERLAELAVEREDLETVPTQADGVVWKGTPRTDSSTLMAVERIRARFREAMDDDFGTPGAVAALFELAHTVMGESMAVFMREPNRIVVEAIRKAFVEIGTEALGITFKPAADDRTEKMLVGLVNFALRQREAAREAKDFKTADAVRTQLDNIGITVEDTPQGPTWRRKQIVSLRLQR